MNRHRVFFAWGGAGLALLLLASVASGGRSAPSRQSVRWPSIDIVKAALGDRAGSPERTDEALAAAQWYYGQRMFPGTQLNGAAREAGALQARALKAKGVLGTTASWTPLGPVPMNSADLTYNDRNQGTPPLGWSLLSGRVAALAVQPGHPNTVYMAAAAGGVWKSTDQGGTWAAIGEADFNTQSIGALAVDPNHPNDLYVGSGEATSAFENFYGDGVYYSRNGGETFIHLDPTPFVRLVIYRIQISNARHILVATNQGLFKSINHGLSWNMVLAPGRGVGPGAVTGDPGGSWISDVAYVPGTGDQQVLAAVGWRNGDPHNGLYFSNDGGDTWSELDPQGWPHGLHRGRTVFDISESDPNVIYAIVQDPYKLLTGANTNLNGIYRSTSGPNGPWTLLADSQELADETSSLSPEHIGYGFQPGVQAWYNIYVYIDPQDNDNVVAGLEEVYNSHDGGQSWTTIGRYWNFCKGHTTDPPACYAGADGLQHKTTHPDQHALAFTVVNGTTLMYEGNDGGVWKQFRDGSDGQFDNDSWITLNDGLNTSQPYYVTAAKDGVLYAGNQDNGTVKYTGQAQWPVVVSGDGGDVATEPGNSDHAYHEFTVLTIQKTKDGGRTWASIFPPDAGNARFIAPFELDPEAPTKHLWALGQRVWHSHKGINTQSDTWINEYNLGGGHYGTAIAVRGPDVYASWCGPGSGCNPGAIDGSSDAPFIRGLATNVGGAWHQTAMNNVPNRYVTAVWEDPANHSHILLTLSAFSRKWIPGAGYGHVYESFDAGENFTDISTNLPDMPANDVLVFEGRYIVATDIGVYERLAGGAWVPLASGLPPSGALDLVVQPGSNKLIVATHGRGMWEVPL